MKLPREFWLGAILFISYCSIEPGLGSGKDDLRTVLWRAVTRSGTWPKIAGFTRSMGWMQICCLFQAPRPACPAWWPATYRSPTHRGVGWPARWSQEPISSWSHVISIPFPMSWSSASPSNRRKILKGKSLGISRLGSASDVAVRALIRGLGLEPDKQVLIMQVGGPAERAASFRTGRIAGVPSPPGDHTPDRGNADQDLISTADFQKRFEFPYICATTTRSYLSRERNGKKSSNGAHRGGSIFQEPQGRDQKNHLQIQ